METNMKKNLPIVKQNSQVILSKTKNLMGITNKIFSDKIIADDDSWMQRLWDWADEFGIPELYLKEVSESLAGFPRDKVELLDLKSLELSFAELDELPKEIGQLTNLTSLDIWSSRLPELPKEIGQLTNLISLELSGNNLSELPKEIGQLTNLTSLDLSFNNLSELPTEIIQLLNLKTFDLRENTNIILTKEQDEWIIKLKKSGCSVSIGNIDINEEEIPF